MKCYQCEKKISNLDEPQKLTTKEGEEVYVHEACLWLIDVDNNGVIK